MEHFEYMIDEEAAAENGHVADAACFDFAQ
jgi:hypothetical protein